jgi:hypothetical protein
MLGRKDVRGNTYQSAAQCCSGTNYIQVPAQSNSAASCHLEGNEASQMGNFASQIAIKVLWTVS